MPSLQWIGKEKVVNHHQEVPFKVLEHQYGFTPNGKQDTETDNGNKIIHGDNLEALKALLPEYEGRIKCIYIDPPYNTGEEKWVYNDNVNDPRLLKWLGEVVGKPGEDFTRHDKWLCMMYPRLVLLRQLLTDDGAIFISIDDNEQERLKCLCNEVFGATCFVGDVIWEKNYSPKNDSKGIPTATDHILVYGKQPGWKPKRTERTDDMDERYKNPDNDVMPWKSTDACAPDSQSHQGMIYAIQHPFTGKMLYPTKGRHWAFQQIDILDIMKGWCEYELRDLDDAERRAAVCGIAPEEVKEGVKGIVLSEDLETSRRKAQAVYDRGQWPRFYFTNGGQGGIARKTYLDNVQGKLVTTLWPHEEVGHTDGAKKELKTIFGGNIPFDTPKPVSLIERILQIATDDEEMDAFLFSCYTGIPYSDMCLLTNENLSLAEDGTWWIKSSRKKTSVDFEIPLMELPFHIIEKYRDMAPEGKLLPMYSNSSLNRYLKRIAEICGIGRKLVFHAARHTYATEITLSHGVPLETVSKMLGHSRIETTQHYAKVTDNKIDTDTKALDKKIAERFSVVI